MNTTLVRLKTWGCDVDGALNRLVNDESLYITCLKLFAEDDSFSALEKSLQNNAYSELLDHTHTLKGVASNLGITPVFDAVANMVTQLRAQDYANLQTSHEKIVSLMKEYCDILNNE